MSTYIHVQVSKGERFKYPIGNIHILKSHGQSALDSELIDGFALNCTKASQAMPSKLEGDVKIALLDFNLQKHKMQMGVQVVVTDTKQVEEIRYVYLRMYVYVYIVFMCIYPRIL